MMLIGLAGSAGTGKDTVADYLVAQHGFTKFSFSDALYREVSEAFGVSVDELKHRGGKELPHPKLVEAYCKDPEFAKIMRAATEWDTNATVVHRWVRYSPRWVLQHWGTEYRRAQDPEYWLKAASLFVQVWRNAVAEINDWYPAGLVNTSVRFPNEQAWIDDLQGVVWHVQRGNVEGVASELHHAAEQALAIRRGDHVLTNDGSIEQLNTAVTLLLNSAGGEPTEPWPADEHAVVVSCDTCGRLHAAYTLPQVQHEIDQFNSNFDALSDDTKELIGRRVEVKDYIGCMQCGGESFHRFDTLELSDDHRANLSPVLCEGNI